MAALSLELDGEWLQADTLAAFFLRPQIYRANEKLGQAAWQEAQAAAEGISLRQRFQEIVTGMNG